MASKLIIPEVLNHYNVYNDRAKKLIGISGEIDLGELEAITDTIEGTGILGEIEYGAQAENSKEWDINGEKITIGVTKL